MNTIADSESRVFNDTSEWKTDPQTISPFLKGCEIDLFASRLSAQLPKYVSWRPNPEALHADALTINWTAPSRLRLPTLQPHSSCTEQSDSRQSRHHVSRTSLAGTAIMGRATSPHLEHQAPPEGPSRPPMDTSNVSQTTLSRVSHLQKQYQTMGISENVGKILFSAYRPSTRKTYKSAWGRWSRWCDKRKVDPFSAPLAGILLYLTEYFNGEAVYRSVNVARSASSTTHAKLDGLPVGQHPLVIQLLKGMFNNRPPKPRYSHTWGLTSVTKYLVSNGNNGSLSLKQLSLKLAMLFSLHCKERDSVLTKLDVRYCRVLPEGVEFTLSAPRKKGSTDQLPKAFFFDSLPTPDSAQLRHCVRI